MYTFLFSPDRLIISHVSFDEQVFDQWNKTELDSFLIEITAGILRFKDEKGNPLVEHIKDTAGQVIVLFQPREMH